tara:strand:+ start:157 stop:426 length:270 start_codon:yes stop_codon:yes gene_type:complete
LEKERTNALEVAKKTYEEGKKEETKAKILDLSIYFITYSQNIILFVSVILLNIRDITIKVRSNNVKYLNAIHTLFPYLFFIQLNPNKGF